MSQETPQLLRSPFGARVARPRHANSVQTQVLNALGGPVLDTVITCLTHPYALKPGHESGILTTVEVLPRK